MKVRAVTITRGKRELIRDLSLDIKRGERWAVLGRNGCGKSTLLHTLAGLLRPASGSIMLQQHNIFHLPRKVLARAIGLLLQDYHFHYQQRVWDYVAAGRFPHRRYWQSSGNTDEALIHAALKIMDLPLLTNVQQLSGGEKRRATIAALIVQAPRLYLLDEPTNHLDIQHQVRVMDFFSQTAVNGASVIMSLHNVNCAHDYSDKVLLLFGDGEYLAGTTHEILTEENVSRLYQHPLKLLQHEEKHLWLR